jgi:hypothetical protein
MFDRVSAELGTSTSGSNQSRKRRNAATPSLTLTAWLLTLVLQPKLQPAGHARLTLIGGARHRFPCNQAQTAIPDTSSHHGHPR